MPRTLLTLLIGSIIFNAGCTTATGRIQADIDREGHHGLAGRSIADAIWDSVEIVATLEGTEHKAPKTDDDWKALRRHAVALVEASNLLLIPGRHVARSGEKPDDARVDLHPEEIEALLAKDPSAWAMRAHTLYDAAAESLKAIDAHDVTSLMNSGETLDTACESCHRNYWYRTPPPEGAAGSERK